VEQLVHDGFLVDVVDLLIQGPVDKILIRAVEAFDDLPGVKSATAQVSGRLTIPFCKSSAVKCSTKAAMQ